VNKLKSQNVGLFLKCPSVLLLQEFKIKLKCLFKNRLYNNNLLTLAYNMKPLNKVSEYKFSIYVFIDP